MRRLVFLIPFLLLAESHLYLTFDNSVTFPNKTSFWNPESLFHIYSDTESLWSSNLDFSASKWNFRVSLSPTVKAAGDELKFLWREAYIGFDKGNFELTAGKRIIKWGTGYILNPVGVITPRKAISDPEDMGRMLEGLWMGKVDFYGESYMLSGVLYRREDLWNGALMFYKSIKGTDIYGVLNFPKDSKFEFGAAFSKVFGTSLEIHGEGTLKRKPGALYHRVFFENPYQSFYSFPIYRPEGKFFEGLFGINYTWRGMNIIAEYYHKDWGFKRSWWRNLKENFQYNLALGNLSNCYWDADVLSRSGSFRDYLFLRFWRKISLLDISYVGFVNLQDGSGIGVLEFLFSPGEGLSIFLRPVLFYGKKGSEFGEGFYKASLSLGFYGSL